MSLPRFEIPIANKPPKSIRVTLPAKLFDEIELLANTNGVEPETVIEHAVAYAIATHKNRRTRSTSS